VHLKKKQPIFGKPAAKAATTHAPKVSTSTTPAAAPKPQVPDWKLQEEKRKVEDEERRREAQALFAKQREEQEKIKQPEPEREHEESDLPQRDPEKEEEYKQKLKFEEEKLAARLFRPKSTGETREQVEEHNKHVKELIQEEKKHEEIEKKKEELEHSSPPFPIDENLVLQIVVEINKVRCSPKIYIKHLKELEAAYSGNKITLSNGASWETKEGLSGLHEVIDFFSNLPRGKMFRHSDGLSVTCFDLLRNHNPRGITHSLQLSDGTPSDELVGKYGKFTLPYEPLYGYNFKGPEDLVLKWVLSDGDSSRKDRKVLLNENYTSLGICVGPHSKNRNACIAIAATQFEDNK